MLYLLQMNTECQKCKKIIPESRRGKKKRYCDDCKIIAESEYYENWYKKNGRRRSSMHSIQIMEWRKANPEKVFAHKMVAAALKAKKIKNPGYCQKCKTKTNYLDAHHEDYRKPLDIIWLCISCHRKIHSKKLNGQPSNR